MSSSYVREVVRAILRSNDKTPYYDTVNRAPDDPTESYWCSAEFSVTNRERTTFCSGIEEVGFIQILVFGPPGRGDTEIVKRGEHIDSMFQDFIDPEGRLEFIPGILGDSDTVSGHYGFMLYIQYDLR